MSPSQIIKMLPSRTLKGLHLQPDVMALRRALIVLGAAAVAGHGAMNFPRPRNSAPEAVFAADASCIGEACYWYQVGCFNGCSNCTGIGKYLYPQSTDFPAGCALSEPTNNDPATRTWDPHGLSPSGDFTKYNPWRSPGKAPVRDSCGAASGYRKRGEGKYPPEVPQGFPVWSKGSEVLPETNATVWTAGGIAEVAWSIAAQHGGGYQYRVCPKRAGVALDEACFQEGVLPFVGHTHIVRFNDGSVPDFEINATDLASGTHPPGSAWRRNPVPACNCDIGRHCQVGGTGFYAAYAHAPDPLSAAVCPTGTMFAAPFHGAAGLIGQLVGRPMYYSIVDRVRVPHAVGEYVLSWRWDCEETNQVWNSCADIRVSATEPPTPPPAPAPPAPPPPPPKPTPPPKAKRCKSTENPTCKGMSPGGKPGACPYYGCRKCHDDTTWNCDECCDGCTITNDPNKGITYCAGSKVADPLRDDLVAFLGLDDA